MLKQLLIMLLLFFWGCASPSKVKNTTSDHSSDLSEISVSDNNSVGISPITSKWSKFYLNNIDPGKVTKAGLSIKGVTYFMKIKTVDSSTFESMPQKKIADDDFSIPNYMIAKNPKD